ncbi:sodium/potassium/calcium exchanger 3-like isoform X6 [Lineus longissimus]|uniref:sodium/potassium/calcium exchanger 3-like isoform X6 n=1 Tax=Lineus longissimus TaxID=88925 RepID=UPI00315D78EF
MPSIHKLRPPWLRVIGHRKEKFEKYRWHGRAFLAGLFITGCLLAWSTGFLQEEEYVIDAFKSSRHLLSSAAFLGNDYTLQNCSEISEAANHTAVEWETCDYELVHLKELWVIFYFVCILIVFVALAIICDDFFVPSLEAISEKLHLSEDVAGATFMAAGSSAPELFTSVAGVSYETDVGIGTIVGSAVFNILVIIALTAALSGQVLHLDWRPMTRDSIFYALSIACFIQFSWDGVLELYEAIILLVLYILYIFIMVINVRLMDWMATWKTGCKKVKVEPTEDGEDGQELERKKSLKNITLTDTGTKANGVIEKQFIDVNDHNVTEVSMSGGHARRLSIISHRSSTADVANADKHIFHHTRQGSISGSFALPSNSLTESLHAYQPHEGAIAEEEDSEGSCKNGDGKNHVVEEEEEVERTMKICPCACCIELRGAPPSNEEAAAKGKYCSKAGFGPWSIYILKYILFVVSFPFICLFTWTVPDCSKPHNRKCFLLSFIMSVLWIVILSFALVTVVGRTGCILGIDTYTMGLVVVAIGTSVPDALSSVLVARDGYGDMAVSNAIGSNVFDINLGLGLPFLIRIAIKGPVNLISERKACFMSQNPLMMVPHAKFGFLLLLILGFVQIAFGITRFKLRKQIGIAFVILYGVFLCYAFVQEIHCAQIFC